MVRKCAVVMALAVAVSGFAMASASAAPPIPQVPASAHPWLQTPSPADRPEPFVELRTDPIDVTAGPVTYSMQFRYYQQPSVPGGGREIAVRFTRSAPGKPNVQWHEYEYAPGSALTFTYNHQTLSRAALATGDSVAPSTFAMTYTAVHQHSSSCTLTNGQPGTLVRTNGRLAVSGFKLVSGTKPVFGTVTTRPTYASLVFDPGCDQYFGPRRRCVGTEEVEAGSAYKFWDFSADYGGSVAYQELFQLSRHPLAGAEFSRLMSSEVASATLPSPSASATGATAEVRTTGDPFMTGGATFTSTRAPGTGRGGCLDDQGRRHAFTYRMYEGVLTPGPTALVGAFDTGSIVLGPTKGAMILRKYTS